MAKKKLLLVAILVGAFAALLLYLYADQLDNQQEELKAEEVEVVKASRPIRQGQPLQQENIRIDKVPERYLPPNALLKKDVDYYLDQPLAVNVASGQMILTSDFSVSEISRNLSSKIPEDERALSLPVDQVSGVSGLLRPGDRVDILGTFPVGTADQVIEEGKNESVGYVTMTLLQNVTLLAVGQEISEIAREGQNRNRGTYGTVTMSVTIDEAELLTIAQTRGKITLLLRHRDDVEIGTVKKKTLKQVLADLEVIQLKRETRIKKTAPKRVKCAANEKREGNKCVPKIDVIHGVGK